MHHNIILGPRYEGLLKDIFSHKKLAKDFSLYLYRPTRLTRPLAAGGLRRLLVPLAGAQPCGQDRLARDGGALPPGRSGAAGGDAAAGPRRCRRDIPGDDAARLPGPLPRALGAAFGMEPILSQSAYFRPQNRSHWLKNLFLVGQARIPARGVTGRELGQGDGRARARPIGVRMTGVPPRTSPPAERCCGRVAIFLCGLALPARARARAGATALYAFCRIATTPSTNSTDPAAALAVLHRRLDAVYAGAPQPDPVDRALAAVVVDFAMPRELLDALLRRLRLGCGEPALRRHRRAEGLWRARRRHGRAIAMMTVLMGGRHAATLARACDLGIAMQLTNIARDVGRMHATAGSICRWTGCGKQGSILTHSCATRLRSVRRRRGGAPARSCGDSLRALAGWRGRPPSDCRPAIHAARLVYSEIGAIIRANGCDSVSRRPM